jgi:hypothetical protein
MQETAVTILVLGALAYLGWRLYQRLNKKPDCGSDCGCEPGVLQKTK